MRSKLVLLLVGVGLAVGAGRSAVAQFELGPAGRGGGFDPSELRRQFLDGMDANGDGTLEPNEVPEPAHGFIGRMARRAGLDPSRPMPIDQLVAGHADHEESRKSDDRSRYGGTHRSGRDHDGPPPVRTGQHEVPRVPGFGESHATGFGVNPRNLGGRVIDLPRRYDRRVLENVERTKRRHDKNDKLNNKQVKNRRRGRPSRGFERKGTQSNMTSRGAAYRVEGGKRFRGRMSFRRARPVLPPALPGWWEDRDVNADGQVTMAEFMITRSSRVIGEFMDFDLNGDGIITAREAEIVQSDR